MLRYFAYRGDKELTDAKKSCVDKMIFKALDLKAAQKMCQKKWSNNPFRLFAFENYNNNETFKEINNEQD